MGSYFQNLSSAGLGSFGQKAHEQGSFELGSFRKNARSAFKLALFGKFVSQSSSPLRSRGASIGFASQNTTGPLPNPPNRSARTQIGFVSQNAPSQTLDRNLAFAPNRLPAHSGPLRRPEIRDEFGQVAFALGFTDEAAERMS